MTINERDYNQATQREEPERIGWHYIIKKTGDQETYCKS